MCWTLQPQSSCIHCGAEVNFARLQDPCEFVILESANFGACGQDNWRAVLGPEDATCDDCLIPEDPQINYRFNVQGTPAPVFSPIVTPNLAIARGGPPFVRGSSSVRGQTQTHGSRHISGDDLAQARFGHRVPPSGLDAAGRRATAAAMASPFDTRNPTPAGQRPVSRTYGWQTRGGLQVRGPQGRGRVRPPTPAPRVRPPVPVVEDEEEELDEPYQPQSSSPQSSGGVLLKPSSSKYTSSLNSSNRSSLPRLTLPSADSPFTFGHTPGRPVPNPSPATSSFLATYLNPPAGGGIQQLPPLPAPEDDWVPAEWGEAVPMPAELAHELDYTNADCVFHRHRVYFVTSHAELVGPSVVVVEPRGLKAYVVPFGVYKVTSADVNRREVEKQGTGGEGEHEARLARERARQNQLADERRRRRRGACVFHPCRVGGCPNWHERGQHQPLTPGNAGAFLRASRRRSREKKKKQGEPKRKGKEVAFASDDVFGYDGDDDGDDEEEEEEERGRSSSSSARRSPPLSSLRTAARDENEENTALRTPSTLHLGAGADSKRAPVRLVEKEGEVERRPIRNPATVLTGSPEPPRFPRYAHLQQASGGSTSSGKTSLAAPDEPREPRRKQARTGSAAMRLLDDGPDLGEMRDLQIRELEEEETF